MHKSKILVGTFLVSSIATTVFAADATYEEKLSAEIREQNAQGQLITLEPSDFAAHGLRRIVDKEAGVICYKFVHKPATVINFINISCVPLIATKLK